MVSDLSVNLHILQYIDDDLLSVLLGLCLIVSDLFNLVVVAVLLCNGCHSLLTLAGSDQFRQRKGVMLNVIISGGPVIDAICS